MSNSLRQKILFLSTQECNKEEKKLKWNIFHFV